MTTSNILIVLGKDSVSTLNDCVDHFADTVGSNIRTLLSNYTTQGIGHDSSVMYKWSGIQWSDEIGGMLVSFIKEATLEDSVRIIGLDVLNHNVMYDYGTFAPKVFERDIKSYEAHAAQYVVR